MFLLVKFNVSFKNTTFLMLNMSINSLIKLKVYSARRCISVAFTSLEWYFRKIPITYNLGQNCWDKIENLSLSKKTPLSPSLCHLLSCGHLTRNLGLVQHWYSSVRGVIQNLKNWFISWTYWVFNFYLNNFCSGFQDSKITFDIKI